MICGVLCSNNDNGQLLVFGGALEGNKMSIYEIDQGKWVAGTDVPSPAPGFCQFASVYGHNQIVVIGGSSNEANDFAAYDSVLVYEMELSAWSKNDSKLPAPIREWSLFFFFFFFVFVFVFFCSFDPNAFVVVVVVVVCGWLVGWLCSAAVLVGNEIHVFGGSSNGARVDTHWVGTATAFADDEEEDENDEQQPIEAGDAFPFEIMYVLCAVVSCRLLLLCLLLSFACLLACH